MSTLIDSTSGRFAIAAVMAVLIAALYLVKAWAVRGELRAYEDACRLRESVVGQQQPQQDRTVIDGTWSDAAIVPGNSADRAQLLTMLGPDTRWHA